MKGTKSAYKQCNMKKTHITKSKLAQKLCDRNVWHVNITEPILNEIFMYSVSFFHLIKILLFHWQPDFEAKSVVPE